MNRVALYARVSSEMQEKQATIESQVAQLRATALKQGDIIVQEYRDDGFSGDLLARPGLDRLRDDATSKAFERVLILSPDRLARKWVYGEIVADDLRKHGVVIQFLNQQDDGTEESRLLLGITGLFGQYEKAKLIERIRRGRLHCARSGRVLTSHSPYGYSYIPNSAERKGYLTVNEEQAAVVRIIFDLYTTKGMALSDVAKELNDRGIPTPRGVGGWARSSLMNILRSSTFAGTWHYNKNMSAAPRVMRNPNAVRRRVNTTQRRRPRDQWVSVAVPAIISLGTFDAAQRQLVANRRFAIRNRKRPYLLAGLTRCAGCGRAVCGSPNNGYMYYRCSGNYRFGGMQAPCPARALSALKADAAFWIALRNVLEDPALLSKNITAVRQNLCGDRSELQRERENVARQIDQVKLTEGRLLDAYGAGAIDVDQLKAQMQRLRERRDALTKQLEQAEMTPDVPTVALATIEGLCQKLSQGLDILETDFEQRQRFVRSIVDKVTLSREQLVISGALPVAVEGIQEPFRTLADGSLQQRGHNAIIRFELAVAV